MAHQLVGDRAGLDHAGPADQAGNAEGAFPVGVLLGAELGHGAVRPGVHVGTVVAGVNDDGVVRDAHVVERLEQRADGVVVLDHAVDVFAVAMGVAAAMFGANVRSQVHAGRIEPAEERLARGVLALHVVDGGGRGLVVDRLHALLGQRAGILDGLLADLAEARIDRRIVPIGRLAFQHAARAELREIGRVLRVIRQFRLFLGVEMIEIAEELVEAVHGRQRLVSITDMILAELPRGVAEVLEQAADRRIELAHAHRRAGKADLGQSGANTMLTGEKRARPAVQDCSP